MSRYGFIWSQLVKSDSKGKKGASCMYIHIYVLSYKHTTILIAMLITKVTVIPWRQVYTLFKLKWMMYINRIRPYSIHLSCHTSAPYYWSITVFVAPKTLLTLHKGIIKQLWQEYTELGQPIFTYTSTKGQKEDFYNFYWPNIKESH